MEGVVIAVEGGVCIRFLCVCIEANIRLVAEQQDPFDGRKSFPSRNWQPLKRIVYGSMNFLHFFDPWTVVAGHGRGIRRQ